MDSAAVLAELQRRILAQSPLLFLQTWEEARWERLISDAVLDLERGLVVWTATQGFAPGDELASGPTSPMNLAQRLRDLPRDHVYLLKDFAPYLDDSLVRRSIRDLLDHLRDAGKSLLIMGATSNPPVDLEKDSLRISLPLPSYEELIELLAESRARLVELGSPELELSDRDVDRLVKATLGLTAKQAQHAWQSALYGLNGFEEKVLTELISEKKTLAAGSTLVEFYDLDEGAEDVGGLDILKGWLTDRSDAYSPQAREQGVPLPRGVLLLGVQGCGKSLTARAAARMLSFPLVRVDMTNLVGSQRGESERNLREVMRLADAISPVVFWMDEIEKGFAGGEGEDATLTRLMGAFLTWMSEQKKPVFVVATANSVNNLPSEMIRRGRFDELFFVDLPNYYERRHIVSIHLTKRNWKPDQFNLDELSERTEGYSGAELEQVVSSAIVEAFAQRRALSQADLLKSQELTVPLSVTMEDKVFALREWAKDRCRRATSDSRVNQMLEAERRSGRLDESRRLPAQQGDPRWKQLAAAGQLKSAVTEFVKGAGHVLFPELQAAFRDFIPAEGQFGLSLKANPNLVLWHSLSEEWAAMINDLVGMRRLYIVQSSASEYHKAKFNCPLAPAPGFTTENMVRPAWLPTALRTSPDRDFAQPFQKIVRVALERV